MQKLLQTDVDSKNKATHVDSTNHSSVFFFQILRLNSTDLQQLVNHVNCNFSKNFPRKRSLKLCRYVERYFDFWPVCSGESRIIFFPERSSICQYPPKISAINIKKQSRARLLLAHPVLYILKIQKTYGTFWKPPFQNQPKSVRRKATCGNLHYLRKWFRQCNMSNLSSLNLIPDTIAYLLILYLQSAYPKIANLIQILYIVAGP